MSVPPEIEARWTSFLTRRRRSRSLPATAASRSTRSCARSRDRASRPGCSRPCARVDEFRRGAEIGHPLGVGKVEQHIAVRVEGRAVIEQQRRAGREAGHQPVPHHPAAGGEIEHAVALADAAMQPMLLEMLEQRAARRMHDAFRHAGRAGGEQDVERMREGQPLEGEFASARTARAPASSATAPRNGGGRLLGGAQIVDEPALRTASAAAPRPPSPWPIRRSACRCTSSRRRR